MDGCKRSEDSSSSLTHLIGVDGQQMLWDMYFKKNVTNKLESEVARADLLDPGWVSIRNN